MKISESAKISPEKSELPEASTIRENSEKNFGHRGWGFEPPTLGSRVLHLTNEPKLLQSVRGNMIPLHIHIPYQLCISLEYITISSTQYHLYLSFQILSTSSVLFRSNHSCTLHTHLTIFHAHSCAIDCTLYIIILIVLLYPRGRL